MKEKEPAPKKKLNDQFSAYAHYSGLAIQMIVIIAIGAFIGVKLDAYYETENNGFTAGVTLFSVLIAIFSVIRQIISKSNKDSK